MPNSPHHSSSLECSIKDEKDTDGGEKKTFLICPHSNNNNNDK